MATPPDSTAELVFEPSYSFSVRVERRFSVPACDFYRAARSGGQDWPKATTEGGAKRS